MVADHVMVKINGSNGSNGYIYIIYTYLYLHIFDII